jgi:hypothetical protein
LSPSFKVFSEIFNECVLDTFASCSFRPSSGAQLSVDEAIMTCGWIGMKFSQHSWQDRFFLVPTHAWLLSLSGVMLWILDHMRHLYVSRRPNLDIASVGKTPLAFEAWCLQHALQL